MRIWFKEYTLQELIQFADKNMLKAIGMEFTKLGDNFIKAKAPVNHLTTTPVGLWHGGASCVVAESLGSCASFLCIDTDKYTAVGIEINANHVRSLTTGYVTGIVTPINIGRSIHIWDIKIYNAENDKLVCVSRLTTKILEKI